MQWLLHEEAPFSMTIIDIKLCSYNYCNLVLLEITLITMIHSPIQSVNAVFQGNSQKVNYSAVGSARWIER